MKRLLLPLALCLCLASHAWAGFPEGQAAYKRGDYATAIREYRPLAEQGHDLAQAMLGMMYYSGDGVAQDYNEAMRWSRKAAEQGIAVGQYFVGRIYFYGLEVPQNYTEANAWFSKAAEQGLASAQFYHGFIYYSGLGVAQNYVEANIWFRKAAEQGDGDAQCFLGLSYYYGNGVAQNYTEAMKWFHRAAEEGQVLAQHNLGSMYRLGQGVTQNYIEAVKWYRRAAEQGYASAQNDLGLMCANGFGVAKDFVQAHMWFNLAASNSTGEAASKAATLRDTVAKIMTPAQIVEAQRLAAEWKPGRPLSEPQTKATKKLGPLSKLIHNNVADQPRLAKPLSQVVPKVAPATKGLGDASNSVGRTGSEVPSPDIVYFEKFFARIKQTGTQGLLEVAQPEKEITTSGALVAVVRVRILKDGRLERAWLEQSSGNPEFDMNALGAVVKGAPFPPPPATADETYEMGVRFRVEGPQK